jgi:hypothetical protein
MIGEGLTRRPLAGEGRHLRGLGRRPLCCQLVLRRRGFELFELQLELAEEVASDATQAGAALRALTEPLAPSF